MLEGFQLENPRWLWGLAVLPLFFLPTMSGAALSTFRGRLAWAALRTGILSLMLLALAEPVQTRRPPPVLQPAFVIVSDRSLSTGVGPDARSPREAEYAAALARSGTLRRVFFAAEPWTDDEPVPVLDGTDIEAGLTRAAAALGGRPGVILLFSDGRSTTGDAVRAAARLRALGHRIHALAVGTGRPAGPQIAGVELPARARLGQPARFLVRVRNEVREPYELRLLDGRGAEIDRVSGPPDGEAVLALQCLPAETGFQSYQILIAPPSLSTLPAAPTAVAAPIIVEGPPRVLLIDTVPDEAERLKTALAATGLQVDTAPPLGEGLSYENLLPYDAVVLCDCAVMGEHLESGLIRYVEESGGGLVFIGGRNVRTASWYGSRLEQILPIEFQPEKVQAESHPEDVHVCFILDRSGSMGGCWI